MPTISSSVALAILGVLVVIGGVAVLVVRFFMRKRFPASSDASASVSKADFEAQQIVREAREQARSILSQSQEQSNTMATEQRAELERRAKIYRESLEALAVDARNTIQQSIEGARRQHDDIAKQVIDSLKAHGATFSQHLDGIEKDLDTFAREMEKQAQEIRTKLATRAAEAGAHLDQAFLKAGAENRARVDKHLETLLKKAQDEIDQYREARKRIVDMHMVELVGETAKIVLHKALTADDHAELVREALEEAKAVGAL